VRGGAAAPDPFVLPGVVPVARQTAGRSLRSLVINPSERTLVLIGTGQSLAANTSGALYTVTNGSKVDNFNICDGAAYDCAGELLGCSGDVSLGPGNVLPRIADKLIDGDKFDRVIIASIAIGGTSIAQWATGEYETRHLVTMRRLASRSITPATPGVTFAALWMHGEAEAALSTTTQQYEDRWAIVRANLLAAGFSGRMFIPTETMNGGSVYAAVQTAQAAIRDGSVTFSGGNLDADVSSGSREGGTHLNAGSAATAATSIYNAMVASGAPF
jgi:hypothetical protein